MNGKLRTIIRQKIIDTEASPIPDFTRRDVYIPNVPNKAIAVIGMRRVGKTTFLWQVLKDRVESGFPREGILFFSFDDERLMDMTVEDLQLVVEEFYSLHPEWRDRKRSLFILDEIQLVPGWERFVRRILDTENVELYISGSSARMLSREVATSMRGRALEAVIFPFSFREFLRHRNEEIQEVTRLTKAQRSFLRKRLDEYLLIGGFPEAQRISLRDRIQLLKSYVDITLLRDVIERYDVTKPVALRIMTRNLLANPGGMFSVNRFYNDLKSRGIKVSKDLLYEYLSYLEDAFLVQSIWLATDSERKRWANPRKIYPIDQGFNLLFDPTGQRKISKALENVVFIELLRRGAHIEYVKTEDDYEVDFLARWPEGRKELIQVCSFVEDEKTQIREIRALLSAQRDFPDAELKLITLYPESFENIPENVNLIEVSEWLLSAS